MKSKEIGNEFEKMFFQICRLQGIAITRVPDGCRNLGKRLVQVKSPFDWILSLQGKCALIDTKTTKESWFRNVNENQLAELLRHESAGVTSGYVVWFRKTDRVIFLSANHLRTIVVKKTPASDQHGIFLGMISQVAMKQIFR